MSVDLVDLFERLNNAKSNGSTANLKFIQSLVNCQFLNAFPLANRTRALRILPYVDWSTITPENNPLEHVFKNPLWADIEPHDFLLRNRETVLLKLADQFNFDDMEQVRFEEWQEQSTTEKCTWTSHVLLQAPGDDERSEPDECTCTLKLVFKDETCAIESIECMRTDGRPMGRLRHAEIFHEELEYGLMPDQMPGFVSEVMDWIIEGGRADLFSRQAEIPQEYFKEPSSRFLFQAARRNLIHEVVRLLEYGCDPYEKVRETHPPSPPGSMDSTPLIDFIGMDVFLGMGSRAKIVQAIRCSMVAIEARRALRNPEGLGSDCDGFSVAQNARRFTP